MLIAALILLVLVAILVLWVLAGADSSQVVVDAAAVNVTMNGVTLFLLGAVCAALAALALWMIKYGSKRSLRQRRERKDLKKRVATAEEQQETERHRRDRAEVEAARGRVAARDAERAQAPAVTPDPVDRNPARTSEFDDNVEFPGQEPPAPRTGR
ncbi:hypothetical protein ACMYYO_02500 [Dermacoccaceae bacterium W4C1]